MRTALEVATARADRTPTPIPASPPPPCAPAFWLEPPSAVVAGRLMCNGGDEPKARLEAAQEFDAKLGTLKQVWPGKTAEIENIKTAISEQIGAYHVAIEQSYETICEIQQRLVGRAGALKKADEMKAKLTTAKAQLDSPASLNWTAEQLVVAQQQVRHLPAEIAASEVEALEQEIEIGNLCNRHGITVESIVNMIQRAARAADGRILAQDVYDLRDYLHVKAK